MWYFTARVTSRPNDPDKPNRQLFYLRALKTLPDVEIIFGRFLEHIIKMPLAYPVPGKPRTVDVIKTEEKGSDVNIASHMIDDGYKGLYQAVILVSNDSDLVEPVRIVREELRKPVIVLNPFPKSGSVELRKVATFVKPIRQGVLKASQFPDYLEDRSGVFHKPLSW